MNDNVNNVVIFTKDTTLNINPNQMLKALAAQKGIRSAVVILDNDDGSLTYHSSETCRNRVNYWLDKAKHFILHNT
jgi:hypothetical protein